MSEVGIRALKQNASAVVSEAAAGTTVTITDRGQPVAQLTPLPVSRLDGLLESGRARPARTRPQDLPMPSSGPALTDELDADRGDRL